MSRRSPDFSPSSRSYCRGRAKGDAPHLFHRLTRSDLRRRTSPVAQREAPAAVSHSDNSFMQSHFFTFSPSFTSWRMASESLGLSCCFSAQASISALSSGEPRSPIIGVLPVRGRPGPRFFGLATIDLPIIWVLQKCNPGGTAKFRARERLKGVLRLRRL